MKQLIFIPLILFLASCGGQPQPIPAPPAPIPVIVCDVKVKRVVTSLDTAETGQQLEKQNSILRKALAQLKAYSIDLEAALTECGGKIN